MLSASRMNFGRVPMIRFRYGKRDPVAAAVAAATTTAGTANATTAAASAMVAAATAARAALGNVVLPARFQPRGVSQDEMDCVLRGGADWLPLGVKPAAPKKKK